MNGDERISPDGCDHSDRTDEGLSVAMTPNDGEGDSGQSSNVQRVVSFTDLAGGTAEVIIEHEGQKYRLRATRNGRLLLNK